MTKVTESVRTSILKTLALGGVLTSGVQHLAVAREIETKAICQDIDSVADGGGAFRLLQGTVGSGKTFMQYLARAEALQRNLVVAHIELGKEHRLYARDGSSRKFLTALMSNLYTRTSTEPGALRRIIELWISDVADSAKKTGGNDGQIKAEIVSRLRLLKDHENGQALAHVLAEYYAGWATENHELQDAAIRWIRAEFSTKAEARELLGIRTVIRDEDVYSTLKLFALFCRMAGFGGLYVIVDELGVLVEQLGHIKSREGNYGAMLKIANESIQGGAQGLGFLFSGTEDAIRDEAKGVFSYAPLRSRLKPCSTNEEITRFTPIIPLKALGYEHMFELLRRVAVVHAGGDAAKQLIPDEGIQFYVEQRIAGSISAKGVSPRDVLRPFVELLARLEENPEKPWQSYFAKSSPAAK